MAGDIHHEQLFGFLIKGDRHGPCRAPVQSHGLEQLPVFRRKAIKGACLGIACVDRRSRAAAEINWSQEKQSLPRRLLLDFRDLTQSGFPFDRVEGDFGIERGVASTRNLQVRGVQALILLEGQADLVKETQDLQVWVVPEINAGAASLAYAVINPAVGLGTLLGQIFLRRPLAEAATRQFHVTGAWDAPVVAQIERKPRPQPQGDGEPPPPAQAEADHRDTPKTP
jgi:hypothetical protein